MSRRTIEIMDTTLRDGEQTNNLSYSPAEKLNIARLLLDKVKVDRIEVASARVSKGEEEGTRMITKWARSHKAIGRVEVLGFVDHTKSVDWIKKCGGRVINLLTKGSYNHLKNQLRKSKKQHFTEIAQTVDYAHKQRFKVNVYLEDWSNGWLNSRDYVFELIEFLISKKVKRIMLPDTLGILYPGAVFEALQIICEKFPGQHFDFHPQNDYGLGTVNVLEALRAGAGGVHTTVNCLGERAGNAALAEVVAGVNDHLKFNTRVNEKYLFMLSSMVETFSGKRIAQNAPIVGEDVFTHTAGIHADGNKKGSLYDSKLLPARFGRQRSYALGKMAGKASLELNLKQMGIELSEENRKKVLERVIELGDMKQTVSQTDLPFIVADVIERPLNQVVKFTDVVLTSGTHVKPVCSITLTYKNKEYRVTGSGDGGYDAFMNAVRSWAADCKIKLPTLVDYEIRIPPGGRTSALVECRIVWQPDKGQSITTISVHSDQVMAAVSATQKMINLTLQ